MEPRRPGLRERAGRADARRAGRGDRPRASPSIFPVYRGLRALSTGLDRTCVVLTGSLLAAIVLSNAAEIGLRSLFSISLAWVFEVNTLLATWIYFIGICQVYYRRGDIVVDFVTRRLPPSAARAWTALLHLVSIATLAVIAWYGARLIELQLPFRTPGIRLPSAAFTVPVVAGAIVMAIHLVTRLIETLAPDVTDRDAGGRP